MGKENEWEDPEESRIPRRGFCFFSRDLLATGERHLREERQKQVSEPSVTLARPATVGSSEASA